ncbi:MAG: MlaD family protein [Proteobacteria bacterium]|nr:MlaD family protein [Pseudomonadota bacterium]
MQNKSLNYAALGLFVIAMIAAAIGATVALSGHTGPREIYTALFNNVADVKFGTQVRYEGFPVGQVEEIRPVIKDGAMEFHLDLSVQEGWKIPVDSVARIGSSSILGGKTVEIRGGKSTSSLKPGDKITSAPPTDMFAAMSSIAGEFGDLSRNGLRPMVERMSGLVASADNLIAKDLSQFVRALNDLAGGLQSDVPQIAGELRHFAKRLNTTLGSVQTVLSNRNMTGVTNVVKNVEQMSVGFLDISKSLQGSIKQINDIVVKLDHVVESNGGKVSSAVSDARYIMQSLARNIDNFNHNISGTAQNMNEFSRLIRQNPGLLLGGSPPEEKLIRDIPTSARQ